MCHVDPLGMLNKYLFSMRDDLLKHKPLFEKYLKKQKHYLSAFSFVNIFAWQGFFTFEFKIINDALCVFARGEAGTFMYLPPLAENVDAKTIEKSFEYMQGRNKKHSVARIENVPAFDQKVYSAQTYSFYNKGYEYLYYRNNLVSLTGNPYKSKRAAYNYFVNHYDYEYLIYDPSMFQECLGLYKVWAGNRKTRSKDDIYRQMIEENEAVHALVLKNYQELDLIGRVVRINGNIKAYTFGFAVSPEIFCILFEITDLSVKGLPAFIFREFCRDRDVRAYKFINAMDDFGMPDVAKTKMSFRPAVLLPSYVVQDFRV